MAQITEAACLIQSGNLYPYRNGFRTAGDEDLFVGFKPGGFSIYFGDAPIYHFDLEGRWQRAYMNDRHYLKALDTTTQTIERVREGANMVLHRETLDADARRAVDEHIREMAAGLVEGFRTGALRPVAGPDGTRTIPVEALEFFLGRIASWFADDWETLREDHARAYLGYPTLPPNALNAVVLQATRGNRLGRAFGGSVAETPGVPSLEEFRGHAVDVKNLLGKRLCQSRSVFLDGPDLLRLPISEILPRLQVAREYFPTQPGIGPGKPSEFNPWAPAPRLEGFQVFLDEPTGVDLDPSEWASLHDSHLIEVAVGLTSGDPAIRASYGSDWTNRSFENLIALIKGAGLKVTVLTLLGAGPSDAHASSTLSLLEALPLGKDDLIALVDANEFDRRGSDRGARAEELEKERARFTAQLKALRASRGVKFAPYSTEKQWL